MNKAANISLRFQKLPNIAVQTQQGVPSDALRKLLESFTGPIIFSVESKDRRKALGGLLAHIKVAPKRILRLDETVGNGRYLMISTAKHSLIDSERNLALVYEDDLLREHVAYRHQGPRRTINPNTLIRNLVKLHPSQSVVRLEYGVDCYAGMTTLEADDVTGEYLMLIYANSAKLYVPVSSLHLTSRYIGGTEKNAPLHRLGGGTWSCARQKIVEEIRNAVTEPLDIYT